MRTKALILTAAALAAGLFTASAQVYSQNIVGYVNVPLNSGFNLIANPLNTTNNTLDNLFSGAGFGDTVYKYNGATFDISTYIGFWSPNLTLNPGEGAFYSNGGASNTVTFVGEVLTGNLTNSFPSGFSIRSSQVPQSDTLENLNFPAGFGDTVYFYRNGSYEPKTYIGFFSPAAQPAVGEAFWISSGTGGSWQRTFNP